MLRMLPIRDRFRNAIWSDSSPERPLNRARNRFRNGTDSGDWACGNGGAARPAGASRRRPLPACRRRVAAPSAGRAEGRVAETRRAAGVPGQRTSYSSSGDHTLFALREVGGAIARTAQCPAIENVTGRTVRPEAFAVRVTSRRSAQAPPTIW